MSDQAIDRSVLQDALYQLADDPQSLTSAGLRALADQLAAAEGAGTAGPGAPGQQQGGGAQQQQGTPATPATLSELVEQLPGLRRDYMQVAGNAPTDSTAGAHREAQERLAGYADRLNAALDSEAAAAEAERAGLAVQLPGNPARVEATDLAGLQAALSAAAADPTKADVHALAEQFNLSMGKLGRQLAAELGR